ncbi:hypothetical protein 162285262 [Organic Lake phycodnavirus 1]|jgi:hypothetical protein|nr:hypothetical protein 162285262 [Organic Lake phycodnavirus 1]
MSSTKNTIEITNMDKQSNETFSEIINAFFIDMEFDGMIQWGLLFLLWIVPAILSVNETVKHCEQNIMYILLSFLPFINIILYFTIKNICKPNYVKNSYVKNTPMNQENSSRNGVGIRSTNVYPSAVYNKNRNRNLNKN